jgi:hypothetical protein
MSQESQAMMGYEAAALHDFDFLIGRWKVHHRRLKDRLAGSHEWAEFVGTSESRKVLGGQGNMDDNVLNLPGQKLPMGAIFLGGSRQDVGSELGHGL